MPNIEELLSAVCDRSAQAVISQAGIDSEPLRRHLQETLGRQAGVLGSFLADPLFEGAFGWVAADKTMADLAGTLLDPDLVDAMDRSTPIEGRTDRNRFAKSWWPHRHQLECWEALCADDPISVLASSGTGSGKTECFLVPILNDLARQSRVRGRLLGVQAIFLYPLNALINSQRDRLTDWTHDFGGRIRYCLYTGETPEEEKGGEQILHPSRVMSRKLLRKEPPPILVTNVTMLEYMLVRTVDRPILEASRGKLKWIVLDEAHSYVGSQAAELALLLRRVMKAFGVSSEEVRFVATSATIGKPGQQREKLERFLADVAGVPTSKVRVIEGEPYLPPLPVTPSSPALPVLDDLSPSNNFHQLCQSEPAVRLRKELSGRPLTLDEACSLVGLEGESGRAVTLRLISAGVSSEGSDGGAFLPVRLHLFHRAQAGLWACVNPACPGRTGTAIDDPTWPYGTVVSREADRCPCCGAPIFEIASCTHCSAPTLLAEETAEGILRPPSDGGETDEYAQDLDLPEESDEDTDDCADDHVFASRLVVPRGTERARSEWLDPVRSRILDTPNDDALQISLADADECPRCGGRHDARKGDLFRRARYGAPFLLGNIIPHLLETISAKKPDKPVGGRQLITFTDSRQETARFAAKLQQDSERNWVRSVIYHLVQEGANQADPASEDLRKEVAQLEAALELMNGQEPPPLRELYLGKKAKLEAMVVTPRAIPWKEVRARLASRPELELWMRDLWENRDASFSQSSELAEMLLVREFLRRPRRANSAETMGLTTLTFPAAEVLVEGDVPAEFKRAGLGLQDWKDFVYICATHFVRANSAIVCDPNVMRWIGTPFARRRIRAPLVEVARLEHELPWPLATSGARITGVVRLLAEALRLNMDDPADRDRINECMEAAWRVVSKFGRDEGRGFQLDVTQALLLPVTRAWFCPITGKALPHALAGLTPYLPIVTGFRPRTCTEVQMPRLPFPWLKRDGHDVTEGEVRGWLRDDPTVRAARQKGLWTDLHDRIAAFAPYFRSAEHSAQQPSKRLQRYEARFKEGEINVLCCSTTMEMGVDIGGVSTVVMTNVPPAPANYRQRVGRAGRRRESLSVGVTFCGDNPLGWTVFNRPDWPFKHAIRPPSVSLDSPVIVQRHVNALLLSEFLRHGADLKGNALTLEAGTFFKAERGKPSPCDEFIRWCEAPGGLPADAMEGIAAVVARTCLEGRSNLRMDTAEAMAAIRDRWLAESNALEADLAAISSEDRAARTALQMQFSRMTGSYLLGELAGRGFLPGYGFPTDVVPFVIPAREGGSKESERIDNRFFSRDCPSRPLELAIRDYAPGADVVVDGLVYRSGGLTLNWKRPASEPEAREIQAFSHGWHCRSCGATGDSQLPPQVCTACGGELKVIPYIRPAGFAVDVRERPHTDITRPSYLKPTPPWISAGDAPWVTLPDPSVGRYRVARTGHVFHYAFGSSGNGYAVCLHCGHAEEEPAGAQGPLWKSMRFHKPLRGNRFREGDGVCQGTETPYGIKRQLALGHSISTDVIELQLFGLRDTVAARSLAVAMREALTRELGIESAEVGWAALPSKAPDGEICHSVILYDLAAGGAGFSSSAADWAGDLLRAAERVLDCLNPDCRTACHACLISRDTHHDADRLDRHAALNYLRDGISCGTALPEAYLHFGESSRPEPRPILDALDLALHLHPEAGLTIWLAGDVDEWDLPVWRAVPLLEKWGAKGRDIRVVTDGSVLKVMTLGQRVAFGRLMERARAKVLAGTGRRKAPDGKATVIAELSSARWPHAWAVALAGCAAPNAMWGGNGAIPVVSGHPQDCPPLQEVDLADFLVPEGDKADLVPVLDELDGPVDRFGARFWDLLVKRKPEIDQLLSVGGDLLEVSYHDRYLFSPLTLRLVHEILQPVVTVSGSPVRLTLETLASKGYPTQGQPCYVDHDWAFPEHRNEVMEAIWGGLCPDPRIILGNKWELPHDRTLNLRWQRGWLAIHLDQGLGHWGAKVAFNFAARPEQQADNLLGMHFDVRHRGEHPMVMFVRDPQLQSSG